MHKLATTVLLASLVSIAGLASQGAPRQSLDIYYIDTEGGQSTLFVSPAGESLLVDTGNFKILETSPGLEDLWQLHWSYNVGVEHNAPGAFIANLDDNETIAGVLTAPPPADGRQGGPRGGVPAHAPAHWLLGSAHRDGSFTVTNPRNSFSKTYVAPASR